MIRNNGEDPRAAAVPQGLDVEQSELVVARRTSGPSGIAAAAVLAVAGVGLFVVLNEGRASTAQASTLVTPAPGAIASLPEPELALPAPKSAPLTVVAAPMVRAPTALAASPLPTLKFPVIAPKEDPLQRRRAPAVVVDLGTASRAAAISTSANFVGLGQLPAAGVSPPPVAETAPVAIPAEALAAPLAPGALPAAGLSLNSSEAFAARLTGGADVAVARPMRNPEAVVPQGAVVPAVLETAINSDLPGFARAIVSRDVRSFDGRTVLIPRGSRLVGQYKSAVSLGQSRAFVVWTRVTRPDGVSVDIGSPAADELGRGGLEGDVDRHFFTRYGGAILLSVLNGIVASIGGSPATTISIGSPAQAASAAASARQDEISPTVRVPQGEAIRIFVARDLDFSLVGPMR